MNLILIAMIFITLAGCNNKENEKEIETVECEMVGISGDMIYLKIKGQTYGSIDFIFDKSDDVSNFENGDLVEIKYYDEQREDFTGKKFIVNHLEDINKTEIDNMYKDGYKIGDLISFEVKMIKYSIPKYLKKDYLNIVK